MHICSVSQILASLRRNPFRPGTEQDLSYKPSPLLQHLRIFYITLTYSLCLAALVQFSMLPIQQLSLTYNFPFCCSHEVYFSLSTALWLILNVAWVPGKCSWKLSDWQEVSFSHGPVSLFIFTVFFFSHFFFVFFFSLSVYLVYLKQRCCEDYSGGFLSSVVLRYELTAG